MVRLEGAWLYSVLSVYLSVCLRACLWSWSQLQPENACVLREGRWINDLPASQLVPGDIVFVKVEWAGMT